MLLSRACQSLPSGSIASYANSGGRGHHEEPKRGNLHLLFLDPEASQIDAPLTLFSDVREFMKYVPDRSGEND